MKCNVEMRNVLSSECDMEMIENLIPQLDSHGDSVVFDLDWSYRQSDDVCVPSELRNIRFNRSAFRLELHLSI